MDLNKSDSLLSLQKGFIQSLDSVFMTLIYDRNGLIISRFLIQDGAKHKPDAEIEAVYGAITSILQDLVEKISVEFKIGVMGGGTFETQENRIIYLVAGEDAILFCICQCDADVNEVSLLGYIVCEKIAKILEGSYDETVSSLSLPNMNTSEDLSHEADENVSNDVEKKFKIVILGSDAVGKTSLIRSYLKKSFNADYRSTIGVELYTYSYEIKDTNSLKIKLNIWDLAGQDYFKRVRRNYYSGADCALIVYDITRKDTFSNEVKFWLEDLRRDLDNIPVVLIGNKIDLVNERKVSTNEGKQLAETLNCSFYESSALENKNVDVIFNDTCLSLLSQSTDTIKSHKRFDEKDHSQKESIDNTENIGRLKCPKCGSVGRDISLKEDKTKLLHYIDYKPIYARVNTCRKCGHQF